MNALIPIDYCFSNRSLRLVDGFRKTKQNKRGVVFCAQMFINIFWKESSASGEQFIGSEQPRRKTETALQMKQTGFSFLETST